MIEKGRIKLCFQRAAATYEEQAVIQQRVADHLLAMLQRCAGGSFNRVLEIGCCTGLLTGRLTRQYPDIGELVLNDLVEEFALRAGDQPGIPAIRFLAGDIENLELPGPFELIISSSTFHWISDLPALLAKLAGHLTPGGTLAFSLYGPDNLREIRELTGIGLDYHNLEEVTAMTAGYLDVICSDERLEPFFFSDPSAVLAHLRETGVNAVSNAPWTPRRLEEFLRAYREKFSDPRGVRLTYHPQYLVARLPQAP
jgi:malonyl-ACP O-methyltransferase BioC